MIKKTNNNEVLTHLEAQMKYEKLYFSYFEIERNVYHPPSSKITVVYTADTEKEIYASPDRDENDNFLSISEGYGAGDPNVLHLGGVYIAQPDGEDFSA
ncbi:MAG: hypothetical protein FWG68_09105 [Defluviitaleaceae bacterium]|nr:hypothetical protein [Defluviitaleaceae bacterium]